jgi:exonuclease SbcD
MKILHTADWHLGKRLENFSRMEEQRAVLEEICAIADANEVDAIIIAGDLFDAAKPPVEAEELLYKTLKRLSHNGTRAVIAIAGNHDSADRIAAPDPLARECGIIMAGSPDHLVPVFYTEGGIKVLHSDKGFVSLKLPGHEAPLRILLTPYANESRLRKYFGNENPEEQLRQLLQDSWQLLADAYCDADGVNILVSHLLMINKGDALPEEPDGEKSILYVGGAQAIYTENIPAQVQYVALGHLHRHHNIGTGPRPVMYSGSPLAYSMSEAGQEKFILIVHAEPGQAVSTEKVLLMSGLPLHKKRFGSIADAIAWLNENPETIVELGIETDTHLLAEERRMLASAHSRIIGPIPYLRTGTAATTASTRAEINLEDSLETQFKNYFKYRQGQEVNDEILGLFREVMGSGGED